MPRKPRKSKVVSYELLGRSNVVHFPIYALLDELIEAHHDDLRLARIALAWCTSWTPDVDGRVTLGKCKRASDLDRELASFDFIVLLRRGFWMDERVTDAQRRALLDHELMHAALKRDAQGEPVEDERGRLVYRIRKHDLEEFTAIVQRHGLYKADLEQFAAALRQHLPAFKPCILCQESPGWVAVTDENGINRVARCPCWKEWSELRADAVVLTKATA